MLTACHMTLSNLDRTLCSLIAAASSDDARQLAILREQVELWREDERTPSQLIAVLRRGLGGIWLSTNPLHQAVYNALEAFGSTVDDLGGMTMNERLVMFDLIDQWDRTDESGREALYRKLEARAA